MLLVNIIRNRKTLVRTPYNHRYNFSCLGVFCYRISMHILNAFQILNLEEYRTCLVWFLIMRYRWTLKLACVIGNARRFHPLYRHGLYYSTYANTYARLFMSYSVPCLTYHAYICRQGFVIIEPVDRRSKVFRKL